MNTLIPQVAIKMINHLVFQPWFTQPLQNQGAMFHLHKAGIVSQCCREEAERPFWAWKYTESCQAEWIQRGQITLDLLHCWQCQARPYTSVACKHTCMNAKGHTRTCSIQLCIALTVLTHSGVPGFNSIMEACFVARTEDLIENTPNSLSAESHKILRWGTQIDL